MVARPAFRSLEIGEEKIISLPSQIRMEIFNWTNELGKLEHPHEVFASRFTLQQL